MKASSGRLGQYLLLNSEEILASQLVATELFTEASFNDFIGKYKMFVIKPVYGAGEISVIAENNMYRIISKANSITCADKEEVYQYIVRNEIKQRYYVIKPLITNNRYSQGNYQYLVTVHRKSVIHGWCLLAYTEKTNSMNGKGIYRYFRQEIENISMLVANKLGESFPKINTIVIEIVYDMNDGIWIQDTELHYPRSKWNQYLTLTSENSLQPFIPETDLLTKVAFKDFLYRYKKVIIKPCYGKEGLGIVQISLNYDGSYEIHSGVKKMIKANFEEMYHYIEGNYLFEKYYVIQQRLPLATINDCPIDSRVIVQKVDSTWRTTGKIVKVASRGFFITNTAQELLSLKNAVLASNIPPLPIDLLENKIDEICIASARLMEENNIETKIIGFDIGITDLGEIWIIEGNYNPNLSMFNQLEDNRIYLNMLKAKRN